MQGFPIATIILGLSTFVQVQVESKHLLVETSDREEAGHDYADSSDTFSASETSKKNKKKTEKNEKRSKKDKKNSGKNKKSEGSNDYMKDYKAFFDTANIPEGAYYLLWIL